jgi:hypothetical protein
MPFHNPNSKMFWADDKIDHLNYNVTEEKVEI